MARRSSTLLLLAGGVAPSLAACAVAGAGAGPSPMHIAYADVPPPPAELFAATNGKADAPLQVDGRMAVALLAQRAAYDAAAARAKAAPVQVAAAAPVAARPVQVAAAAPQSAPSKPALQVAEAKPTTHAPAAAARVQVASAPVAAPTVKVALAKPVVEIAAFAPPKPLPYAEFVRADVVMNAATPLVRPMATASVKSGAALKRRARVIAAETKAPVVASTEHVAAAAAPPSGTVVWLTPHRTTKQARVDVPVMTRIDTLIRNWFARIRS